MIYFSGALGGFLDDAIHSTLPPDAVEVAADHHARLLAAQSAGKRIVAGPGGRPVAKPRAAVPIEAIRGAAVAWVKSEAARRIEAFAPLWRQVEDLTAQLEGQDDARQREARLGRRAAIGAIRDASNRIEAAIATMGALEIAALNIGNAAEWPLETDDAD